MCQEKNYLDITMVTISALVEREYFITDKITENLSFWVDTSEARRMQILRYLPCGLLNAVLLISRNLWMIFRVRGSVK